MRRAKLGLAGNGHAAPALHEIFLGDAKLVGQAASKVQNRFNKLTGRIDTRQLYHVTEAVNPDGAKALNITLDERDGAEIPKIIRRERKRRGLPPLSEEQLAEQASKFTVNVIENPVVQITLNVNFAYLRHAMLKIAYELAFLWLGESYLGDPLAVELRTAICKPDIGSTDGIAGYIGDAPSCTAFNFWTPHEDHHLAYAAIVSNSVMIGVRIFDIHAAAVVVSKDSGRYFRSPADALKRRFLAIDAASGHTIDTTYAEEEFRIAAAMSTNGRPPPFPDPLSLVAATDQA